MKKKEVKEKPKSSQEYIEQMMKKRRKTIKISIIAVVIIILLIALTTSFAILTMMSNKIIKGIMINDVDVSGLTKSEACQILEEKMKNRKEGTIKLKYNEYQKDLAIEQLEVSANVEETVDKALEKGRTSNIFVNNFEIIKDKFSKQNLNIDVKYNEEELDKFLTETSAELPGGVQEYTYSVEESELIITPGKSGIVLDQEKMKQEINDELTDLGKEFQTDREIAVKEEQAVPIDLDKIYGEIHTDPQDAYIIESPFQVVVDKNGVDFAIPMEEAKALLAEPKDEYVIPLKITKARKTVSSLGSRAFPNELANFTTRYDAGNTSRTTNLAIACKKLNGQVIQPGEVFSYNKALGKRSVENGYKEAAIYANGGVENGLGGGICQISSTLYNAVLQANLGIEERHNHSFITSYVEAGKDATVVYGALDFKFKNTRKYPIKLEAYLKSGVATVKIYGLKEENEYNVKVVATVLENIPCAEEKVEDATLPAGTTKVIAKGTNGCKSVTYKYVYDQAGNLVSKTQLSTDTYGTIKRVIHVGTKPTATPSTTPSTSPVTPTPSPSASTSTSETPKPGGTGGNEVTNENSNATTTPSGNGSTEE